MIPIRRAYFWVFLLITVGIISPALASSRAPVAFPVQTYTPSPSPTLTATLVLSPTPTPTTAPSETPTPTATNTPIIPTATRMLLPTPTHTPAPSNAMILIAAYRNDNNGDGMLNNQDRGAIYLMNVDGSNVRQITPSDLDASDPDMSPDRQSIVFSDFSRNSDGDLYILNVETGSMRFLTVGAHPTWSPDGRFIAYTCDGESNPNICIVGIDGSNFQRLTNADITQANWQAHWSPNSASLYFLSRRIDTTGDGVVVGCDNALVVRVDLDTLRQTIVSPTNESIASISVSADGRQLLLTQFWEYTPSPDGRRCGWNDASEIEILDVQTGQVNTIIPQHAISRQPVFAYGDSAMLYLTSQSDYNRDGGISIVDARVLTLYDFRTGTTTTLTDDSYQWFDIRWIE